MCYERSYQFLGVDLVTRYPLPRPAWRPELRGSEPSWSWHEPCRRGCRAACSTWSHTDPYHPSSPLSSISAGAKAGIIIGIVVVSTLLATLLFCWYYRRRRALRNPHSTASVDARARALVRSGRVGNSEVSGMMYAPLEHHSRGLAVQEQELQGWDDRDGEPWPGRGKRRTADVPAPSTGQSCATM